MYDCSEPDIPSMVPEDLVPTPAVSNIDICAEALSPALQTGRSRRPGDPIPLIPAGTLKSGGGPADACVDDDISSTPPTPSLVNFALENFVIAMSLISLIVSVIFFAVTLFTVLRDARSMKDQVPSNTTGVSLSPCFNGCALLTVAATVGIDTRSRPPTGSQCMRTIHFMDGRCLQRAHRLWGFILALYSCPRGLQTV